MKFYQDLSSYYNQVFPLSQDQLSFYLSIIEEQQVQKVLDAACGTGQYGLASAEKGISYSGLDLEEAMVAKGREEALEKGITIDLKVGDMRNIDQYFQDKYDLVMCTGNSLVHLLTETDIKNTLKKFRDLAPTGSAVIQIVNYDRVVAKEVRELPTLTSHNGQVTFQRFYDLKDLPEKIVFKTILTINQDDEEPWWIENQVDLKPIYLNQLESWLMEAGFTQVKAFGNFKREPWSLDSFHTIVQAL